jgi:hypothetical protein
MLAAASVQVLPACAACLLQAGQDFPRKGARLPDGRDGQVRRTVEGLGRPKVQRPRSSSAGPPVVCLGLAEGAKAFCESKLRQDLMAHALSLSHLTFVTTIRIFHFLWIALLSRVRP